jgi:hypothetical protein
MGLKGRLVVLLDHVIELKVVTAGLRKIEPLELAGVDVVRGILCHGQISLKKVTGYADYPCNAASTALRSSMLDTIVGGNPSTLIPAS